MRGLAKMKLEEKLALVNSFIESQNGKDIYIQRFSVPDILIDAAVIVTASSGRHARGMARGLADALAKDGEKILHMEGFEAAQWILLDCNDIFIHIFQEDMRNNYRLDDLCRQAASSGSI